MDKKSILVVDDSRVSRMMIRAFLLEQRPDWIIQEAANGEEALLRVSENPPDYVTMDMNMPGVDGIETAERIRQLAPATRIVLLTANVQDSSRQKAQGLDIAFVTKPITADSIQQVLVFLTR